MKEVFYLVNRFYDVVKVYYGYGELFKDKHMIDNGIIGESFKVGCPIYDRYGWPTMYKKCDYIVQDVDGITFHIADILLKFTELGLKKVYTYKRDYGIFKFRKDPVPYTSCRRMSPKRSGHYRKVSVKNEIMLNLSCKDYVRPKRRVILNIINDNLYEERSSFFDKYSWKKVKKRKQWM